MFIVLLKFTEDKAKASAHMDGHKSWIKSGFDDGVFLMVGSLPSGLGGGIMAHNTTLDELQTRVQQDPFVAEHIVEPEILEITPSKTDDRLAFLLG